MTHHSGIRIIKMIEKNEERERGRERERDPSGGLE